MSPAPPPYPRTPHLWDTGAVSGSDSVLSPAQAAGWLDVGVTVEEKLDGANVSIWWSEEGPRVASRGGADAMDRGRQLGALRAWAGRHVTAIAELTDDGWALYGEWLWLEHSVAYDALVEPLVVLDLYRSDVGFAPHDERRDRIRAAGLEAPPLLFDGVLGDRDTLLRLMTTSHVGHESMEGVVVRRGRTERAKLLRPGFVRAGDDTIARRRQPRAGGPAR